LEERMNVSGSVRVLHDSSPSRDEGIGLIGFVEKLDLDIHCLHGIFAFFGLL
jgi:hypothetical protein